MRTLDSRRLGFMLRDLVACIVLVVLTLGIAVPGCGQKERELRYQTNNNLRQLGVSVHTANGDFKKLPPAFGFYGAGLGGDWKRATSLFVHLFPYIEQGPAYRRGFDNIYVPTFHAATDPTDVGQETGTGFVANRAVFDDTVPPAQGGRGGAARPGEPNPCSANLSTGMPDGTSNCIVFTTGAIQCRRVRVYAVMGANFILDSQPQWNWTSRSWTCREEQPQPFSPEGIGVCMGDAVTRTVPPSCSTRSWQAALRANDGQNPGPDF